MGNSEWVGASVGGWMDGQGRDVSARVRAGPLRCVAEQKICLDPTTM